MKTKICHCIQCRAVRAGIRKRNRVQTYQVRAAKSRVRRMLKTADIVDLYCLPMAVIVDYYG